MDPRVTDLTNDINNLSFKITNINVSLANALRRIILNDIPCVVFRTTPHEKNDATFYKNTTRFNNEIIKQRISCIPIHITDVEFPIKDYIVEVNKKNDSDTIEYITTKDFTIRNIKTDVVLSEAETRKIFPPDPITKEFIDIVRLRPKLSKDIDGEHLHFTCTFSIGTVKENGSYNVVSTCSYGAARDNIKINEVWTEKAKELKGMGKSTGEIEELKRDWLLLDGKRITLPDAYNFTIESVGVFDPMSIVEKSCQIMINKLNKFGDDIQSKDGMISASNTTIPNSFDIKLEGEDYTLGKSIEYLLFASYYQTQSETNKVLTYCGFMKPHPHIDVSIIRVAFKNSIETSDLIGYLETVTTKGLEIFNSIKSNFTKVV